MTSPQYVPIVTFIGAKPGTSFEIGELEQPFPTLTGVEAPTNPGFLTDAYRALLKKDGVIATGLPEEGHRPPPHMLVRVDSLARVGEWLAAYFTVHTADEDKLRVQFVGHSVSGALSLGGTWVTDDEERFRSPFYVLDSSPRPLTELSLYLGRIDEIMLAGCYIGSRLANGKPVNGRTLLFTLAEMWHCKVRGADTAVGPTDFDHEGWYFNETIPPIGWAWQRGNDATRIGQDTDSSNRRFERFALPPPKRILAGPLVIADAATIQMFCSYFDSVLPTAAWPNLGVNELGIQLDYGTQVIDAYFTCNGQFLAVQDGPAPKFYAYSQNVASTELSRLVAQMRAAIRADVRRSPAAAQ